MKKLLSIICLFAIMLFDTQDAKATVKFWIGNVDSNWANGANWSPAGVPVATDDVRIGAIAYTGVAAQPTLSSALTYASLLFGSLNTPVLTMNFNLTVGSITISGNSTINGTGTLSGTTLTLGLTRTLNLNVKLNLTGAISLNGTSTLIGNSTATISAASMALTTSTVTLDGALTLTGAISTGTVSTVTLNAANNAIRGITVNSNGDLTFGGTGTTTVSTNTTTLNNPSKLTIGSGNTVTFTAQINVSNNGFFINNGTVTTNSQISVNANPSSFTNGLTGTLNLNSTTLYMGAASTFTNNGNINGVTSTINFSANPITGTNTGTINLSTTSALTLAAGTNLANSGTISATSSTISLAGNPAYITNSLGSTFSATSTPITLAAGTYITNTGSTFTAASSNITFGGNPSYIINQNSGTTKSVATVTNSTISLVAGAYITNTGSDFSTTSSPIIMNGNTTILTNQNSGSNIGNFIIDGATVSMVAGSSINNYGTFRLRNGAEVTMSYNFAAIRNYSTGDFYVNAATVNFNDQCYIDNAGTFTASNNSFLKSNTSGRDLKINNTGTFYAGTTLSPCIITLGGNANAESIINKSGAFFYIASTSVVAPTGVNAIISNAGTFTIRSDVNGSGTIATLGSAGAITGTYNVERYIQGGASKYRGYRLLSSQVNQGTISSIRLYNFDYIKSGTIVSGTTGAAGGFDSSPLNNPTIFLYREDVVPVPNSFTSGNFKGVNKINSTPDSYVIQVDGYGTNNYALPVGNGFMFFFRGDRTTSVFNKTTQPFADPESIVMTTTGTINQGKVTVRNWTTTGTEYLLYTSATANSAVRGFNLVGNPYPSSIDWNKMNTTTSTTGIYAPNVSTKIWIFNGTVKTYGTFVKGDPTGTNGASNIIPSGQGFYVRATSTAAQVIFNEDAKVNTQVTGSNLLMSLPTETETVNRYFRVNFEKDSVNKEDALVFFNKASKTEFSEEEDGEYRKGLNMVGLSTMGADNVPMAVNHTAFTKQRQVLSLNTYINTSLATSGRYTLKLSDITNMPKQYDVWLKDAYKKDSLDIKNNPNYVFDIVKTDSATFSKRFTLVIRQNLGLTYRLLTFTGVKATEGARLNWRTQNEYNYTFFTLERSTDGGTSFKAIANVKANSQGTYSFVDKNPGKGQVKYRLKQEDFNGDITYSSTVPLMYADVAQNVAATNELSVYPNPAVEKIAVKINQPNTDASSYTVNMFNTTGSIVQTYTTGNTESEGNISALHPGTYFIQVLDSKNKSIVGKSKFVKL